MDSPTIEDGRRLLMECSLFHPLGEDVRSQLAARAHRRRFGAGETIFHMGSEGESMMAVLAGRVRISIPSGEGKQIVIAELPAGEIFGEIALLDGGRRSADAMAHTNCDLIVLRRRDVLPLLEQHPHVCLKLLEVVCRRLRDADERMTDILFFDAPVRLAKILLRKAAPCDERGEGDGAAKVALSQRELGTMTGVRRERVNRCLQEWQRRGIIRLKDGWIIILNRALLKEISQFG